MKKELKAEVFTDMRSLCDFVNTRQITQENIQSITEVSVMVWLIPLCATGRRQNDIAGTDRYVANLGSSRTRSG